MSDEITEPTVHLCWSDFAIRGAVHALRMANLDTMADDMEAQLKPAVTEPTEFGSLVLAWHEQDPQGVAADLWQMSPVNGKHYWEDRNGVIEVWSDLIDPEVLRVGIGEPSSSPAAELSRMSIEAHIAKQVHGRSQRFCSLGRGCRMADGHDGGCKP